MPQQMPYIPTWEELFTTKDFEAKSSGAWEEDDEW